ncbi:MAG: cell division topological specificity factor [Herpetosiphonaceae bacterium]|nr:MAG: cell division topological specificity factor [Herpetosiphonaceae bacterium]
MSFLDTMLGRRRESSSHVAKERLLTVLVHDRVKLTPEDLENMKREIIDVISRYVEVTDPGSIEVTLTRGDQSDHLKADIPLRRSR